MFFVIGMIASDISDFVRIKKTHLDIILLATIVTFLFFMPYPNDISSTSSVFFLIIIVCVNKKADLFGLLSIRGFHRLGVSSYSIYIMHASIIFVIMKLSHKHNLLIGNEIIIFPLCYIITLIASTITYRIIEHNFMNLGRKVSQKIK